jgi:hypothetical protein
MLRLTLRLAWERVNGTVRLPWPLVGVAVLIVSTLTAISAGTRDLADQHESYVNAVQDRIQSQVRSPGVATGRGVEPGLAVIRPPNPAVALVGGPGSGLPAAWAMAPAGAEAAAPYVFQRSRQGVQLTLAPEAVFRLFGALFALGLALWQSLNDVARSWPMVSAGWALPSKAIAFADFIGDAAMTALIVVAWFGSVAGYLFVSAGPASPEAWLDWLWLAPLAWLYLLTFAWIGSAVAYSCRSLRAAVMAGAAVWVLLTLVLPQALPMIATWNGSVPSVANFERSRREIYADHLRQLDVDLSRTISTRVGDREPSLDRAEIARAEFTRLESEWRRGMDAARIVTRDMDREYQAQIDHQRRAVSRLGRLMPGSAVAAAAAEVAGSGRAYVDAWEASVQDYKWRLDEAVFDDLPRITLSVTSGGQSELMAFSRRPPARLVDLPAFEAPTLGRRMRLLSAAADAIPLAIHALIALLLGIAAHRRVLERYRRLVTRAAVTVRRP